MENFKMNRKKDKKGFDLPEPGFESQIFSNFPAHDLNFHGRKGDEIKSKQASKRDFNYQTEKNIFIFSKARVSLPSRHLAAFYWNWSPV